MPTSTIIPTPARLGRRFRGAALGCLGLVVVVAWAGVAARGADPTPAPLVLKGVVQARGSMGPFRYKVEGTGPLLPDAPGFTLTTSVPVTNLGSAKPVVELESPRGKITIKITQEISIKEKTVVPYVVVAGTRAYAHASGAGRIKIELLERSGFNGTVRLTFLRPAPPAGTGAGDGAGADAAR